MVDASYGRGATLITSQTLDLDPTLADAILDPIIARRPAKLGDQPV
jgi:hypothetical protein